MSLIAALEGRLEGKGPDYALVRVGGFTLQVFVPVTDLAHIGHAGDNVHLHTQLIVREDDLLLFGFATESGSRMFGLLREVGGVGPRLALAVLSTLSPETVAAAVVAEDSATLSRTPGVGKRTGERIVLELKDKLDQKFGAVQPALAQDAVDEDHALRALVALGFTPFEARQALSVEHDHELSVEERISRALRRLGEA
ncbi:MAG: Holliday junction branch migration protein RuvA [Chloroflexi bacterium]|nr:Holliday junction branch migration protein RuvA [Chloroflexota bacterium]